MATLLKLLPLFACWFLLGLATARYCRERVKTASAAGAAGFVLGIFLALLMATNFKGDLPFLMGREAVAMAFMALAAVAVVALYRSSGVSFALPLGAGKLGAAKPEAGKPGAALTVVVGLGTGLLAGMSSALRLPLQDSPFGLGTVLLLVAGPLLVLAAGFLERSLPAWLRVAGDSYTLFAVSLLLLISSQTQRLDLFAPLGMKVTKFIHDFVHQFFETMLIPDHPFFRTDIWGYIGLLFSNGVGFWGALVIWFTPPLLVLIAIGNQPLQSVSHIRQGAARRRARAGYLRERRCGMIVPWFSVLLLALAVYRSLSPSVEYWDPKPVEISAGPSGEIFIPRKSADIDLADGKLHKFAFKDGKSSVRFFVMLKGDGRAAVALDACAICPPDGYGQAEGSIVCYYCKTLIPIETVGKVGGCNPVPVKYSESAEGVRISAQLLVNSWNDAVQPSKNLPGRGK